MDKERLLQLLEKYDRNTLNYREKTELDAWFNALQHPHAETSVEDENTRQDMLLEFRRHFPHPTGVVKRMIWRRPMVAAAAVTGILLTVTMFYLFSGHRKDANSLQEGLAVRETPLPVTDGAPGTNRAVLILEDGSQIDLDESASGSLIDRPGVQAIKVNDSTVKYLPGNENTELVYHTIRTPRGGQYRLSLPDGTLVWLNAAAALRYPVAFNGPERRVEVSGEAYFEVAKDGSKPFIVSIDGKEEVKVLGTHFNINAYPDNGAATVTLLEGAVRVSANELNVTLKPGQQSARIRSGFQVKEANIEQVIAWKSGYLDFDNMPVEAVMREISRWYDVDIVYEEKPDAASLFGGRISKVLPLSKVLTMLKSFGINAELQNKKVIIHKSA